MVMPLPDVSLVRRYAIKSYPSMLLYESEIKKTMLIL